MTKDILVDKDDEEYIEEHTSNFFGYKDTFTGVGIIVQPQQGEDVDLIAGAINDGK